MKINREVYRINIRINFETLLSNLSFTLIGVEEEDYDLLINTPSPKQRSVTLCQSPDPSHR